MKEEKQKFNKNLIGIESVIVQKTNMLFDFTLCETLPKEGKVKKKGNT